MVIRKFGSINRICFRWWSANRYKIYQVVCESQKVENRCSRPNVDRPNICGPVVAEPSIISETPRRPTSERHCVSLLKCKERAQQCAAKHGLTFIYVCDLWRMLKPLGLWHADCFCVHVLENHNIGRKYKIEVRQDCSLIGLLCLC